MTCFSSVIHSSLSDVFPDPTRPDPGHASRHALRHALCVLLRNRFSGDFRDDLSTTSGVGFQGLTGAHMACSGHTRVHPQVHTTVSPHMEELPPLT